MSGIVGGKVGERQEVCEFLLHDIRSAVPVERRGSSFTRVEA